MKVKIFAGITLAAMAFIAHAQTTNYSRLKPGDKVPDVQLTNQINFPANSSTLSGLKGQIVIVDYWATWCGSCIHALDADEQLQKKYNGKVRFLLVTKESNAVITKFLDKSKSLGRNYEKLTIIPADTIFDKLIKVSGYPTYAWIDKDGILRKITDYDGINETTINQFVSNPTTTKSIEKLDIDLNKPFFLQGNGGIGGNVMGYSIVTKHAEDLPFHDYTEIKNDTGYVSYTNFPIMLFYEQAFYDDFAHASPESTEIEKVMKDAPGLFRIPNSRVYFELKDTSEVVPYVNDQPNTNGWYCYQLILPHTTYPQMRNYMKNDLQRNFRYRVRVEKRRVKCLILRSADTALVSSKGGSYYHKIAGYDFHYRNYPFYKFKYILNYGTLLPPFIDETGIKGNIDIDFTANLKDWRSLADAFSKYKLDLKIEKREIPMLIITDPINNTTVTVTE